MHKLGYYVYCFFLKCILTVDRHLITQDGIYMSSCYKPLYCFVQETLRLMGLPGAMQWMAWFVEYAVIMLVVLVIMTVLFATPVTIRKVQYGIEHPRYVDGEPCLSGYSIDILIY